MDSHGFSSISKESLNGNLIRIVHTIAFVVTSASGKMNVSIALPCQLIQHEQVGTD
jgi:hypothetical protein